MGKRGEGRKKRRDGDDFELYVIFAVTVWNRRQICKADQMEEVLEATSRWITYVREHLKQSQWSLGSGNPGWRPLWQSVIFPLCEGGLWKELENPLSKGAWVHPRIPSHSRAAEDQLDVSRRVRGGKHSKLNDCVWALIITLHALEECHNAARVQFHSMPFFILGQHHTMRNNRYGWDLNWSWHFDNLGWKETQLRLQDITIRSWIESNHCITGW